MTVSIYKLYDDNNVYVGSTKRSLKTRLIEHRSTKRYKLDYTKCAIDLLEECDETERYDRENYWIEKLGGINLAKASVGPVGYKNTEKELKRKSISMKLMHTNRKDIIKRARMNSLTSEKQRIRSYKGHESRRNKLPEWYATNKITGIKYGPFKGSGVADKILGLHYSTICRCIYKNKNNSKYIFEVTRGQ